MEIKEGNKPVIRHHWRQTVCNEGPLLTKPHPLLAKAEEAASTDGDVIQNCGVPAWPPSGRYMLPEACSQRTAIGLAGSVQSGTTTPSLYIIHSHSLPPTAGTR